MTDNNNFDKARKDVEQAFDELHKAAHFSIDMVLGKVESHINGLIDRAAAKAAHPSNGKPSKEQMVEDLAAAKEAEGKQEVADALRQVGVKFPYEILHFSWSQIAKAKTGMPDGGRLIDGLFATLKQQSGGLFDQSGGTQKKDPNPSKNTWDEATDDTNEDDSPQS